jgi:hypothetical protein
MFIPFSEILCNIETLVGRVVSVTGQLLIGEEDRSFLARDHEHYRRGERLPVSDGKLIAKKLLMTLPAYGGGDVIYDEKAFLTGTIVAKAGYYELARLSYCKIIRDDIEVIVPLSEGGMGTLHGST